MSSKYEKYYKVLDLDVGASKEQVKMAFRELSQMYHPDNYARKSPEVQKRSEEKFKKLSNAYQILKDYLSEEDSSREAEEKTKAEQDRRDREEQNRKKAEKNRRDREAENRRKAEQGRRDKEEQNRKKTEKSRREEEVKEKKHWEEQAKKKQDEEWRRKNKTVQFPTNCPICKESITINSTLSQSKTKIHFEVFCKFCKGTYLYFFKDGVPIFPLRSNDNYTESSKEDTFQKNENRGESMIWTIGVLVSKLLAFLLIVFLILFIGLTIFITIQPNDHSDSGSTAKIHKENHLSQSKLSNEIHALYEEVRLSRLSAEQGV